MDGNKDFKVNQAWILRRIKLIERSSSSWGQLDFIVLKQNQTRTYRRVTGIQTHWWSSELTGVKAEYPNQSTWYMLVKKRTMWVWCTSVHLGRNLDAVQTLRFCSGPETTWLGSAKHCGLVAKLTDGDGPISTHKAAGVDRQKISKSPQVSIICWWLPMWHLCV